MKKISWILLMIFFILGKDTSAYVPSGAAFIGSIWPLIVAFFSVTAAFLVKIFWKPIKTRISKLRRLKNK